MTRALPLLAAVGLSAASARAAALDRVVDQAGILGGRAGHLDSTLADYEARTTNQIVVFTLPTLSGEPIEDFSKRTFNAWGLGQKQKDNGVLVVVARDDRKLRIEVGYGLEERLTSDAAAAIIGDVMAPAFRAGDYAGGVERGVAAIIDRLDGDTVEVEAPVRSADAEPRRDHTFDYFLGVIGLVVVIAAAVMRREGRPDRNAAVSSSRSWSSRSLRSSGWSRSSRSGFSGGGGRSTGGGASGSW